MKQVIHIFGGSGSGTSTLGKALGKKLNFLWMDTDDYFWMPTNPPFQTKRPVEERLQKMQEAIAQAEKGVVISGALTRWGDPLVPLFTLAVRLVIDPATRLARLKERERMRYGARLDLGGDMYETHQAFLQWAAQYDVGGMEMRSSAHHDEWQKTLPCKLLVLDGAQKLDENIRRILEAML